MTGLVVEGKYTEAELLGCYPLPNPLHNMHLIKAMREFFTQENPEFLKHIGRFYRTPWLRPAIACLLYTSGGFANHSNDGIRTLFINPTTGTHRFY